MRGEGRETDRQTDRQIEMGIRMNDDMIKWWRERERQTDRWRQTDKKRKQFSVTKYLQQ